MESNRNRSLDQLLDETVSKDRVKKKSAPSVDVRKQRREYILELLKENPSLADTSYSRKSNLIEKRERLWKSITDKVNKKFARKLENISVDEVKKKMVHVKKNEAESSISINNRQDIVVPENDDYPRIRTPRHSVFEDENIKREFKHEIDYPDDSGSECPFSVSNMSLTPEHQKRLNDLLNGEAHDHSGPMAKASRTRLLNKERAAFVSDRAEYYIGKLSLDTAARHPSVNAVRNKMWAQIAQEANDKFKDILPKVTLEQAKKLYSNYKLREMPKLEAETKFDSPCLDDSQSTKINRRVTRSQAKNTPYKKIPRMDTISPGNHPMGDISIQSKTESSQQFGMKLKEKDAQIKMLKKKVAEQAKDYARRVNIILEMVKQTVNMSIEAEIAKALA